MFIIGCVVCALYLTGYLYMIKYANDSHDRDLKNDLEKARQNFSKSKKNNILFKSKVVYRFNTNDYIIRLTIFNFWFGFL